MEVMFYEYIFSHLTVSPRSMFTQLDPDKGATDIDSVLESIQPTSELLTALKPDSTLPVTEFLKVPCPRRPGSRKYFLKPSEWFTDIEPNHIPQRLEDLILPSEKVCQALDDDLRKAVQKGSLSVQHPVKTDVFLPIWVVRAWKWGNILTKKQSFWNTRLDWVRETAVEEGWSDVFRDRVIDMVMHTPWHTGFLPLQNGAVNSMTLAMLLSEEWVNDERINCMLDVIRADMSRAGVKSTTQLASSYLSNTMKHPGKSSEDRFWGEKLRAGTVDCLDIPYNVKNLHWIIIEIDVTNQVINIGDSKPEVTAKVFPIIPDMQSMLTRWLGHYLPKIFPWTMNLNGIKTPIQLDSHSCGIATASAIQRHLIPTAPLWNPSKPGKTRAYFYCRCIELAKGVSLS